MWKHSPAARIIQSLIVSDFGSDQNQNKTKKLGERGGSTQLGKFSSCTMRRSGLPKPRGSRVGGGELDELDFYAGCSLKLTLAHSFP